jgi:hypothetical protein
MTVAYDVVYERVAPTNVEFGEQSTRQARMVVAMHADIYDQPKEKEKLAEVGTARNGAKLYLLKQPANRRAR